MNKISLNGQWQLMEAPLTSMGLAAYKKISKKTSGWLKSTVPGEIHLDLMNAGKMEEPLFSTNTAECRWVENKSWWYKKDFNVKKEMLTEELQELVFEGIDLNAEYYLNGKFISTSKNALVAIRINVKNFLKVGKNELVVRLTCGSELAKNKPPLHPDNGDARKLYIERREASTYRGYLRKAQFSYGWDWVAPLPNIGIWRGVSLETYSFAIIQDASFNTRIEKDGVYLDIKAILENLHYYSQRTLNLQLDITTPKGKKISKTYSIKAQMGRTEIKDIIKIPSAELWWPVGYGDQPLYSISLSLSDNKKIQDKKEYNVGLRTISVDQSELKEGRRFCIQVNGQDVFCKGANWIPADGIMARVDKKKYKHLIDEAVNLNWNTLRVWGGGIYEDEEFYKLCDQKGILLYHDFMFACTDYPCGDFEFRAEVREETEIAIRRLRHHPSIAFWCGNNENLSWLLSNPKRTGGVKLYGQVLPDVCRNLDPERFYWPSSPLGGEDPTSHLEGDTHPWPYCFGPDNNIKIDSIDNWKSRFVTEFGAIGPTVWSSVEKYLKPEELKKSSKAWKMHTNTWEHNLLKNAVAFHYSSNKKLPLKELMNYAMHFNAFIYGHQYESQRFRKHDKDAECAGFLIWMFNDCWGEIGWSVVDYFNRRKSSFYTISRACKPLKVLSRKRKDNMLTRIINDTQNEYTCKLEYGWIKIDGTDKKLKSKTIKVKTNSMTEAASDKVPLAKSLNKKEWIYFSRITGKNFDEDQSVWLFDAWKNLKTIKPEISIINKKDYFEISSNVYSHQTFINDEGQGLFSDNYFDLIPGYSKKIYRTDKKTNTPKVEVLL